MFYHLSIGVLLKVFLKGESADECSAYSLGIIMIYCLQVLNCMYDIGVVMVTGVTVGDTSHWYCKTSAKANHHWPWLPRVYLNTAHPLLNDPHCSWYVCLSVCLSVSNCAPSTLWPSPQLVCLSVCLFVCLSVCLLVTVHPLLYDPHCSWYVCLSVCLSICLSVC